jgi:hypothetical protein
MPEEPGAQPLDAETTNTSEKRKRSLDDDCQVISSKRKKTLDDDCQIVGSKRKSSRDDGVQAPTSKSKKPAAKRQKAILPCEYCTQTFTTVRTKNSHMRKVHPAENQPSGTEPASKPAQKRKAPAPKPPQKRKRSEEDDAPAPKRRGSLTAAQKRLRQCEQCKGILPNLAEKIEHMAVVHPNEDDPVPCWKCDLRFKSIEDLASHMAFKHKEEKRDPEVICPFCEMKSNSELIRGHIKKEHPMKYLNNLTVPQMFDRAEKMDEAEEEKKIQQEMEWQNATEEERKKITQEKEKKEAAEKKREEEDRKNGKVKKKSLKPAQNYCKKCSKLILESERNVKDHIKKQHPEIWDSSLTADRMLDVDMSIPLTVYVNCPVCQKRYTQVGLKRHLKIKHPQEGEAVEKEKEREKTTAPETAPRLCLRLSPALATRQI